MLVSYFSMDTPLASISDKTASSYKSPQPPKSFDQNQYYKLSIESIRLTPLSVKLKNDY